MKFSRILYFLILFSLFCFFSCNGDKGDTSPPELTIISPVNGSVVNEIVSISVNALDNEEIDFVHFFVSDSVDSMIVSSAPYVFNWNTNGLDDGDYIIKVMAQDASGNASDTIQITLILDNTLSVPSAVNIIDITYSLSMMSIQFNKSIESDFNQYSILVSQTTQSAEALEIGIITDITDTVYTTTDFDPTQESWYFVKVSDIYGYFEISDGFKVIESPPIASVLEQPSYYQGTIRFNWSMSSEIDFFKYHLYASVNDDMSSRELLVTNNIKNDTTHTILVDLAEQLEYYQVEIEDHWGFISTGDIVQANLPYKIVKTFGGTQNDRGYAVQATNDGYIVVGSSNSYGSGGSDVWLLKLDFEGQEEWSRTYGGAGNDVGRDVKITSDPEGYIITGLTSSFNSTGNSDMWIIRTDNFGQTCIYDETGNCSDGQEKWVKTYGSSGNDYGYSVIQTDDEYISVGKSGRIPSLFIVKTDSYGEKIWEKLYGEGPGDKVQYVIKSAGQFPSYVAVGQVNDPNTADSDICIIGINSNGDQHWYRTIQYGNSINEHGNYISSLTGGGYIVAGTKQINNWDDLLLMKVNNDGTQSSSWNFGGSYNEVGNYAQELNGGYFISGFTESFGMGLYDAWIIKIDDNGNKIYDHTFGGNLDDKMLGGTNSLAGDPVIVGYTKSFGNGGEDMLFIKIDQGYQQ